jgi:hypothetical protein
VGAKGVNAVNVDDHILGLKFVDDGYLFCHNRLIMTSSIHFQGYDPQILQRNVSSDQSLAK